MYNAAQSLIAAFEKGRAEKQAEQDRQMEQQMLAERLRQMKFQQKLDAYKLNREGALAQFESLNGLPQDQMPQQPVTQPQDVPGTGMAMPGISLPQQVTFPGLDLPEMGVAIPQFNKRPQSLEQLMAQRAAEARMKAMSEPYTLTPGAERRIGNEVVASAPPRPETPQSYTWSENGRNVTQVMTPSEAAKMGRRTGPVSVAQGSGGAGAVRVPGNPNTTGDQYLASLPANEQALVKKIANYEMDLSRVTSLRGGERERIAAMVAQYDPSFDMAQYASRAKLRTDMTSGKGAANIRSLNTAIAHLDTLRKAANALQNGSLQFWNRVANIGLNAVGDPRVTAFMNAATAVEGEAATAFKGSAGTDQEIKQWRAGINASQSPAQLKASIDTITELMGGRLRAITDQFNAGMGKPKDFRFLTPRSQQILRSMGVDVEAFDPVDAVQPQGPSEVSVSVVAPNGKTYSFPNAAAAEQFKRAAGIKD